MGIKSKTPSYKRDFIYTGYRLPQIDLSANFSRFREYMNTYGILIPEDCQLLLRRNNNIIYVRHGSYILGSYEDIPETAMTMNPVPRGYNRQYNMLTNAHKEIGILPYIERSMKTLGIDISKSVVSFSNSFYNITYGSSESVKQEYKSTLENHIKHNQAPKLKDIAIERNITYSTGDHEMFNIYNTNGIFQIGFTELPYAIVSVERVYSNADIKRCGGDIFALGSQRLMVKREVSMVDYILDLRKHENYKLIKDMIEGTLTRKQQQRLRKIHKKHKIIDSYHRTCYRNDIKYIKTKTKTKFGRTKYKRVLISEV